MAFFSKCTEPVRKKLGPYWQRLKPLFQEKPVKKQLTTLQMVLFMLLLSFMSEFLIETMSRHSFVLAFAYLNTHTKAFGYNALLIYITVLPVILFRRRRFLISLILGLWLLAGMTNGILLAQRVTPFTGPDFTNLTEGKAVMSKYLPFFAIVLLYAFLIFVAGFLCLYFFRSPRYKGKMHYPFAIMGVLLAWLGFFGLTKISVDQGILSNYFGNIAFAYQDYGFPYCFTVTVFDTGIDEPNNYSQNLITSIVSHDNSIGQTASDVEKPNIIIVQLESFFDPTRVNYLNFNEDPIPYWHDLESKYSTGFYTVPTIGAGTANTEFETLTGMSLRFFGPGEYPFKGVLKKRVSESVAFDLKALGYGTHGIHNNEANFYSRRTVYKNLGFDDFTSEEYMATQDDVNHNGWMKDENLIGPISDALNATPQQDLVYTVSVQPHGAYPSEEVLEDPSITVSGNMSEAKKNAWEYYVNQLHEEDKFIHDLLTMLESRDEKTIVLLYGDHLPTMGLEENELKSGNLYQTNYLIWDNFGLEKQDRDITAYQAVATIFSRLGFYEGTMFRFQMVNSMQEDNFFTQMQALQYDILYGKRYVYNQEKKYVLSGNYRLGIKDVYLTGYHRVQEGLAIHGLNFTQSCKIRINGEVVDTTYLDTSTLLASHVKIKKGDIVDVIVQSNSSSHGTLSTSRDRYIIVEDETNPTPTPSAAS